jgi:hypothetical protein
MRRGGLLVGLALALLSLALIVGGCGGGSSSSSSSSSDSASGGEGSASFPTSKATIKIVKFGKEGSDDEREAASAVVAESLEAREDGDWATQCATLNKTGMKEVPGVAGKEKECAKLLQKFASPVSATKEIRADQLEGSIAALRVEGEKGYALFHGKDGTDYALALEKEGGDWKVSSVNTIVLTAPEPKKGESESGQGGESESGAGATEGLNPSSEPKAASD